MFAKKIFMSGNPVKTDSIQVDRIFMIIQECCSNLGRNKLFIEFITMPTGRSCFPRTSNICQFDRSGRAEVEVPKLFFCFRVNADAKKLLKSPLHSLTFSNIFRTRKIDQIGQLQKSRESTSILS